MYDAEDIPPDPDAAAAIARAERRLAILEELTEIGMSLARDLGRQGAEPPAPDKAASLRDPADAFARLSRAIRLTLNLEARVDAELAALRAGVAIEAETRRKEAAAKVDKAAEKISADHRQAIEIAMEQAMDIEIEDDEERMACREALDERLDWDEAYKDLDSLTLTEAVRRLCVDLELNPDWSRWTEEGWPTDPNAIRPEGSEFNIRSRRPILEGDTVPALPRYTWPSG